MLVEYLWISLVTSWAQGGQGLGESVQIRSLLDRVDEGQAEAFCGNLAFRTGGICGNRFPRRVGDLHSLRKWGGRRRVDVLAGLAHASFDLAFGLAHELRAAVRVEPGRRQLLERDAGHPLGVHRQELAAGKAQGHLDHLAADPDVALEHLGWEVSQGFLEDVLARGAAARAAGDDALQTLEACPGLLLDGLPGGDGGAQAFDDGLGLAQPLPQLRGLRFLGLASSLYAGPELCYVTGRSFGD